MRRLYAVTEKEQKKAEQAAMNAEGDLAYIEENAAKFKKQRKYGLMEE